MPTPDEWRRIEALYHAAQNCPPSQRAALLEATDPGIRDRVERMLEIDSQAGILNESGVGLAGELTETVVAPNAQLGPYKIEAQVGAGGMGTVYRAVDTRLGRVVAIKVASGRYSARFQLEAQAISTLNHPNICTLYDVGPNYLVMELIEGPTLASELKAGPLAPITAARYGMQIANALAEAHSKGIVHRDLKPSNVMVTRHGVKVLDFGLAKIRSDAGVTATGAIMGTPAYMAPEQARGEEAGHATDLFALGLVLYEMFAGHLPFPGASLGQMLSSGANPAFPMPSRESTGLPENVDTLVSKLLERDPARRRPQSAAEVAEALSAIADRLIAPAPRHFRPIYATALVVLLLFGTGLTFFLRGKAAPASRPLITARPASYTQLTSFTDSATGPVLSPDGHMLAFYRSTDSIETSGDIWLKLLPDGEPVRLTHDSRIKYNIAFSPDGARIAYTTFPSSVGRLSTPIPSPLWAAIPNFSCPMRQG